MNAKLCLCHSGKNYEDCCQPFHDNVRNPESALLLMRSRYAAYAGNLPHYLMETTHPKNSRFQLDKVNWAKEISAFSKKTQFVGLDIIDFSNEGEKAFVTFTAHLRQGDSDVSFTEKSSFEKINGRWLYLDAVFIHPKK